MARRRPGELNVRERLFVDAYTGECLGNASASARKAGCKPTEARQRGRELLGRPDVHLAIKAILKSKVMDGDEARARLSDLARGDLTDYFRLVERQGADGSVVEVIEADLVSAYKARDLRRLKKVKVRTYADGSQMTEVELEDRAAILYRLAKLGEPEEEGAATDGGDEDWSDYTDAELEQIAAAQRLVEEKKRARRLAPPARG